MSAKPVRLQRSRRKGATLVSPNGLPVVYVGRGSKWGNPFSVREHGRAKAYALFSHRLRNDRLKISVNDVRKELRGRNLACWCGKSEIWCHGNVLLEIANSPESP